MEFRKKMRVLRIARELTQKDLQELTGIDSRYLSEIETGKILPNLGWEHRIKEALNWPEDEGVFEALVGQAEEEPT